MALQLSGKISLLCNAVLFFNSSIYRLVATIGQKSILKKVSRKAILDVNVPKTCKTILQPGAPMALRLQASMLYELRVSTYELNTDISGTVFRVFTPNSVDTFLPTPKPHRTIFALSSMPFAVHSWIVWLERQGSRLSAILILHETHAS
jgi:hypothetical protein